MAAILTGLVKGMRPVEGIVEQGKRKGDTWKFISIEITDTMTGTVWSCQLREEDEQFADYMAGADLNANKLAKDKDLTNHKVKVRIVAQSAGEREIEDKASGQKRIVLQIRTTITNIRDLGLPKDDEE